MNDIQIFWDARVVGRRVVTRDNAGSKLDFYADDPTIISPDAKIIQLTGPSYPKLGPKNGKTRVVRFRVE